MQRITITIVFLIISIKATYSQESVFNNTEMSREGVKEVINTIPHLTQKELYNKASNWVKTYYSSTVDGLTSTGIRSEIIDKYIENEKIIISKNNLVLNRKTVGKTLFSEYLKMNYTLILSFKEGKYKFSLTPKRIWKRVDGKDSDWELTSLYRKNGKPFFMMKKSIIEASDTLNNLNKNLFEYLNKKESESEPW